jgi:hypothetical protein
MTRGDYTVPLRDLRNHVRKRRTTPPPPSFSSVGPCERRPVTYLPSPVNGVSSLECHNSEPVGGGVNRQKEPAWVTAYWDQIPREWYKPERDG